jgi:hypothetical protein
MQETQGSVQRVGMLVFIGYRQQRTVVLRLLFCFDQARTQAAECQVQGSRLRIVSNIQVIK